MANPYEPGTMEYLDYATSAHDKAMAPKPKAKKKKKMMKPVQKKPMGLAEQALQDHERRRSALGNGLGGAFKAAFSK